MFGFIHDIEWMRARSKKYRQKQRKRNVRRNFRRIYREIKYAAKMGLNKANIRFDIYKENVLRYNKMGYTLEKHCYTSGLVWEVSW